MIFPVAVLALLAVPGSGAPLMAKLGQFGKHDFPDPTGKLANEFQVIQRHKIRDHRNRGVEDDATYKISSVSPTLIDNDEVVTVQYESSNPSTGDWIAAYSPSDVNIYDTAPVKFGYCDEVANYLTDGEGFMTFNLTNLRSDVKFYYFTNGLYEPVLVGESDQLVQFNNINQPLRPRVVATGDVDVLNLVWSSASSQKPQLRWSATSHPSADYTEYENKMDASTGNITQDSMCGSPAKDYGWRELGAIHTASFVGMTKYAGQQIYYIFGDKKTEDFSQEFTLFVPPLPGILPRPSSEPISAVDKELMVDMGLLDEKDEKALAADGTGKVGDAEPVRFTRVILYDDLGRGSLDMSYTWNEYGRPSIFTLMAVGYEVAKGWVDAIYHGGDISYATGYMAVWDFFLDMISPAAASTVYLTTVGNHESDWYDSASEWSNGDSGGECGVPATVLLPEPAPAKTNKPWWSYDVGMIHMVGMSTEHNFDIGSEQYEWLEADLAAVDRTVTPWIVFGGHRAMYLNSDYVEGETSDGALMDDLITNIEPLLYKYRVNIGFYGHNHVVQRHTAVLNRTVVQPSTVRYTKKGYPVYVHNKPQATVHMVVGTGGAAFTVNYVTPYPEWNEMVMYQWGYARVTAVNATHLAWQWIEAQSGEVMDRMVIIQSDPLVEWDADTQAAQYQQYRAQQQL